MMSNDDIMLSCGCGRIKLKLINDSRGSGVGAAYRNISEREAKEAAKKAGIWKPPPPTIYLSLISLDFLSNTTSMKVLGMNLLRIMHYGTEWRDTVESMTLMYSYDVEAFIQKSSTRYHILPQTSFYGEMRKMYFSQSKLFIILVPEHFSNEAVAEVRNILDEIGDTIGGEKISIVFRFVRCMGDKEVSRNMNNKKKQTNEKIEESSHKHEWKDIITQWESLYKREKIGEEKEKEEEEDEESSSCICSCYGVGPVAISSQSLCWSDSASIQSALSTAFAEAIGAFDYLSNPYEHHSPSRRCVIC